VGEGVVVGAEHADLPANTPIHVAKNCMTVRFMTAVDVEGSGKRAAMFTSPRAPAGPAEEITPDVGDRASGPESQDLSERPAATSAHTAAGRTAREAASGAAAGAVASAGRENRLLRPAREGAQVALE
jgi:hypothetical protein